MNFIDVEKIAGWSHYYTHLTSDDKRNAMRRLPDVTSNAPDLLHDEIAGIKLLNPGRNRKPRAAESENR